jgi:SAM-dependent methyltransferase
MKKIAKRWLRPLIKTNIIQGVIQYQRFISDWRKYKKLPDAEPINLKDSYPCLFDRCDTFSPGSHYFYQDIWAFTKIYNSKTPLHIDVGSKAEFISFLTAITNVEFVDIRPLDAPYLKNLKSIAGSILQMPYGDNTVKSLSCLHVAEHIGLGRYGDPLDPKGTEKAVRELARILAPGGNLYFSLPVGKPKVCFNAHRIHSPRQILEYFSNLKLVEFSAYDDQKRFIEKTDPASVENNKFACGMFWFTKL